MISRTAKSQLISDLQKKNTLVAASSPGTPREQPKLDLLNVFDGDRRPGEARTPDVSSQGRRRKVSASKPGSSPGARGTNKMSQERSLRSRSGSRASAAKNKISPHSIVPVSVLNLPSEIGGSVKIEQPKIRNSRKTEFTNNRDESKSQRSSQYNKIAPIKKLDSVSALTFR